MGRFSGTQLEPFLRGLPVNKPFTLNVQESITFERDRFNNSMIFKDASVILSSIGDLRDLALRVAPCLGNEESSPVKFSEVPTTHECEAAMVAISGPQSNVAIASIAAKAWALAASSSGSRVVQRALELADVATRDALAGSLRGHVLEAATSPSANYVLQKCIEVMAPSRLQFVVDELCGHVNFIARSKFGCRVLERILEHFSPTQVDVLIAEALNSASELSQHGFGNFVMQHILRHGTDAQRASIITVLLGGTLHFAKHRIANHVVSCALNHCSAENRIQLLKALEPAYDHLQEHHCGSFVAREMRRCSDRKAALGGS